MEYRYSETEKAKGRWKFRGSEDDGVQEERPRLAIMKIKREDGDELVVKNFDDITGEYIDVDFKLERDKFLNPSKYAKKDTEA